MHKTTMRFSTIYTLMFGIAGIIGLGGCAVGPNYARPLTSMPRDYSSTNFINGARQGAGVESIGLNARSDIPGNWWTLYKSEQLNHLVKLAIEGNPDLAAAHASLLSAEEQENVGWADLFPSVDGTYSASRRKTTGASGGGNFPGSIYSLHNASVNVTYGFDLFGLTRRNVELLESNVDYEKFLLEGSWLSVTANVVTTVLDNAALRDQVEATEKIVAAGEKRLDLFGQKLDAGLIDQQTYLTAKSALEQTRATLPPLQAARAASLHQASILIGETPDKPVGLELGLSDFKQPPNVPLTLTVALLDQRPDILAAEAQLRAASAAIGVAIARRLPGINLSAAIGTEAPKLDKLFLPGSGLWSFGAALTEPLFDAGALASKQASAEAEYARAKAVYKKTILAALKDVADTLHALKADTEVLRSATTSFESADKNYQLVLQQRDVGATDNTVLYAAEQDREMARITLIKAKVTRMKDTAALLQALGGGWWNKDKK